MFAGHHLVFIMDIKPKSALHETIVKRLVGKECICGCKRKIYRNGLSRACHYAMEKELYAINVDQRTPFINRRIRQGLWLTAELVRFFKSRAAKSACK